MRLHFATPEAGGALEDAFQPVAYLAGVRNVLVTFATVGRSAAAKFWIEGRDDTRLSFAAAIGSSKAAHGGEEAILAAAWPHHISRLLSFADSGTSGRQARKFWIEERNEALKLYVAGNGKSKGSQQLDYDNGVKNRLLSYAFAYDWGLQDFEFWIGTQPQGASVMLDSGAFSAWRLGCPIDLGKYCEYISEHKAALDSYIVLDVIGSIEGTEANLIEMRRRGLDPLPVYHSDREPLSVWEKILAENTGYVCLGGLAVNRPTDDVLEARLKKCWAMVEKHWPVKIHGLGVLTQWMLERYPFYSVDGSSAIMGAGMGQVQRFVGGRLAALNWQDDAKVNWDGSVVDGIGRVRSETSKSESAHIGRRMANIKAQLALERYVTRLWAERGIVWDGGAA